MHFVIEKFTLIVSFIRPLVKSFPIKLVIRKLTFVVFTLVIIYQCSKSLFFSFIVISYIFISIWPLFNTFTFWFAIYKKTLIYETIRFCQSTISMKLTINKFSFILSLISIQYKTITACHFILNLPVIIRLKLHFINIFQILKIQYYVR